MISSGTNTTSAEIVYLNIGMSTTLPSVSVFSAPRAAAPYDVSKQPTLTVHHWLCRDIVRGVFQPEARLKVEHLTSFYSVGHSPVREAIALLATAGLVTHEHNKGYRVAPVSLADYDDVLDAYLHIYQLAASMAVERGGEDWEERVVVQLHRTLKVRKVLPEGGAEAREQWQRAFSEFHHTLLSGCGSPILLQFHENLGRRLERYVNLFADLESDRERDHHTEHRQIVDAAIARDFVELNARVETYFKTATPIRESIRCALQEKGAPATATAFGTV